MIEKLKNIEWLGKFIFWIIGFIIGGICWVFSTYNDFEQTHEDLLVGIQTTQQMALKGVIWNSEIPVAERASACDVYLASGYNSLTKKECQVIIEIAENDGIFSRERDNT